MSNPDNYRPAPLSISEPRVPPARVLRKLSWWHESIIDWMLLHPEGKLAHCAKEFSVSASWLSIIVNSDLFRARLAVRRAELAGEIGATVVDRLSGIAGQALESIAERIEREKDKLPIGELRETASMALDALGYSGKKNSGAAPANVYNFNGPTAVSPSVLEAARRNMRIVGAQVATQQLTADNPDVLLQLDSPDGQVLEAPAPRAPSVQGRVYHDLDELVGPDGDGSSDPLPTASTLPPGR